MKGEVICLTDFRSLHHIITAALNSHLQNELNIIKSNINNVDQILFKIFEILSAIQVLSSINIRYILLLF